MPDRRRVDDFGLKPLRAPGAEDLYDVINERYEKGSIALTSNRDRAEWSDLFGAPPSHPSSWRLVRVHPLDESVFPRATSSEVRSRVTC